MLTLRVLSRDGRCPPVLYPLVDNRVVDMDHEQPPHDSFKLTDIHGLGPAVFGENAPSVRTLRSLAKRKVIPYYRIGRLMRFDPRLVRAALDVQCLIEAKRNARAGKAVQS